MGEPETIEEQAFAASRRVYPQLDPSVNLASAAGQLPLLLCGHRFRTILEIGTLRGWSALALSFYADTVITVDVFCQPWARKVFETAGIEDRVVPIVVANDKAKAALINQLNFDFAFIDGDHTREGVKLDFELTSRCGSVAFHDYPHTKWTGIKEFVDTLPADELDIGGAFAWWRSKGD